MKEIKAKELIKLGTAIRYLGDVKYKMSDKFTSDEPLGDGHVIDNINHVINLISELDLTGTLESGAYGKLKKLRDELNTEIRNVTIINLHQAERLFELSKIIRGSLLSEGNIKLAYYLEATELEYASSPGWPKEITFELLKKTPANIWKWLGGVIVTSFFIGITVSETGISTKVVSFFSESEKATTVPVSFSDEATKKEKTVESGSENEK